VLRAEEERLHRPGPRRRVALGLQVVEVAVLVVPAVAVVGDVAHRHDHVVGDLAGAVAREARVVVVRSVGVDRRLLPARSVAREQLARHRQGD
jgi:hypothetical protein